MKVVVFSCLKYSDAWPAFFHFFRKFWPNCPYELHLVTDAVLMNTPMGSQFANKIHVYDKKGLTWNDIVSQFCLDNPTEPILMLLEDYWLTAPVRTDMIQYAHSLLERTLSACVRLYPCPGGDEEVGDLSYAIIRPGTKYRISTQAAIWVPGYLEHIAASTRTPWAFELEGSKLSDSSPSPIYGFKRAVQPWPLEYICTAIVQGVWQANAYNFCKHHGIAGQVDWTKRPMQVAE